MKTHVPAVAIVRCIISQQKPCRSSATTWTTLHSLGDSTENDFVWHDVTCRTRGTARDLTQTEWPCAIWRGASNTSELRSRIITSWNVQYRHNVTLDYKLRHQCVSCVRAKIQHERRPNHYSNKEVSTTTSLQTLVRVALLECESFQEYRVQVTRTDENNNQSNCENDGQIGRVNYWRRTTITVNHLLVCTKKGYGHFTKGRKVRRRSLCITSTFLYACHISNIISRSIPNSRHIDGTAFLTTSFSIAFMEMMDMKDEKRVKQITSTTRCDGRRKMTEKTSQQQRRAVHVDPTDAVHVNVVEQRCAAVHRAVGYPFDALVGPHEFGEGLVCAVRAQLTTFTWHTEQHVRRLSF